MFFLNGGNYNLDNANSTDAHIVIPDIMRYVLIISMIVLCGLLIRRILRLDLSLSSLLAGLLASFLIPYLELDTGIRASNIQDLVFYVILPLLIFISAWRMNPRLFLRWFLVCFLLATVGVLMSVALTATGLYYAIAHPTGFPWIAAFLAATMMAATDPVSVSAQLKTSKVSEELQTLFEGESLLNDASVIILFGLILTFALGKQPEHNVAFSFLIVLFGGMILGAMLGLIAATVVKILHNKSATVLVIIFTAFGSFYIAEALLHVSGIMTVMTSAVVTCILLRKIEEKEILSELSGAFNWLDMLLNSVIFGLLGLVVTWEMFTHQWLAIIIGIVAVLVARFASIYLLTLLLRKSPHAIPYRWALLLSWGGLKGAIAIVLALSLPVSLDYWWTIQSMVFGVVLFSLIIQGSSFPFVLRTVLEKR
ncbi:MAG: sodium:proton antiporter [Gammaproteobacteria bacterium]|nr:sodium:proton antiporter [Gammaproteobacteria bacterium]